MKKLITAIIAALVLAAGAPAIAQVTMPLHAKLIYKTMPREAAAGNVPGAEFEPYRADSWYKGNTHCHSHTDGERMPAHGDGPPEATLQWYADRGYDFVVLTDHNIWQTGIEPPPGLLYIKGEEVTHMLYHANGLGMSGYVRPLFGASKIRAYQHAIDGINAQGAVPVINHPITPLAYVYPRDLKKLRGCRHFEVYNMQPGSYNRWGEPLWDGILTEGHLWYGMITDDAHMFASDPPKSGNPPGLGWIMVDAGELTRDAIIEAIREGRFYSSTGVLVGEYSVERDNIRIKLEGEQPAKIQFVGAFGEVLHEETGTEASYLPRGDELYVRVRAEDHEGKLALMQPVFFK